jgi:hypothetical protein
MSHDNESTRREAKQRTNTPDTPADIESILEEIEGIVSGLDPHSPSPELDANPSPEPSSTATEQPFDLATLEQELDDAIEAELGVRAESPIEERRENTTETADTPLAALATTQPTPATTRTPNRPTSRVVSAILRPLAAPVARLDPQARLLLSLVSISLALWAPVVLGLALYRAAEANAPEPAEKAGVLESVTH